MNSNDPRHRLIAEYQTNQISDDDFEELQSSLKESSAARKLFHRACRIDSFLRRESENASVDRESDENGEEADVISISSGNGFAKQSFFKPFAAAAAFVLLSALTWTIAAQKRVIATLVSSEGAAWESMLPTEPGSPLTKGSLRLSSGIATIQFVSGAQITLEAPARMFLKGPVRASLVSGTVVVKSDEDRDFVLDTEYGQAVSQRGEYAAIFSAEESRIDFEGISGSALVSHDVSREVTKLSPGATASMYPDRIESSEMRESEPSFEKLDRGILIRTNGHSATFIKNNNVYKWTRPEFLTLKTSRNGNGFDQRSVIAFDLSKVTSHEIADASLRLNLVHSGHGLISRLPKVNQFAVYGVVNPAKENWSNRDLWDEAPSPKDGVFLMDFEVPRSQTSGSIHLSGAEFLNFIREKEGESASFILVRKTTNLEGDGPGYTHAIASGSHPEAAGPVLEITLKN